MRLALPDDYQRVAREMADWSRLPAEVDVTIFEDRAGGLEECAQRFQPFEIVLALRERTKFSAELLARLPHLQMLVNAGVPRAPGIDLEAATRLGILVCGAPGSSTGGVVQLTWALILGLARHLVAEDRAIREGSWGVSVGVNLTGRTLGLCGLGRIGGEVAAVGRALGMHLIAWSPNLTAERAAEHGARAVSKEELFRQADVVSVHLRLGERTRGIIGAHEIALMKPSAFFVNVSRGALVDEQALVAALADGRIAGAGLDVFTTEPLPSDAAILSLPNTLLTPHIGYVNDATYRGFYEGVIDCVEAFLKRAPINVLNPDVLESPALRATRTWSA